MVKPKMKKDAYKGEGVKDGQADKEKETVNLIDLY
jgi:hypothetical protein